MLSGLRHDGFQLGGLTHSHYEYFPAAQVVIASMNNSTKQSKLVDLRSGRTRSIPWAVIKANENRQRPFVLGRRERAYAITHKLTGKTQELTPEANTFIGSLLDAICIVSVDGTKLLRAEFTAPDRRALIASAWDVQGNQLLRKSGPIPLSSPVNEYEVPCMFWQDDVLVMMVSYPHRGLVRAVSITASGTEDRLLWSGQGKYRTLFAC